MALLQRTQVAQLLGTTDIFNQLQKSHLEAIAKVCKVLRFDEGAPIVKQGDPGDELFIIASGRVAVVHEEPELGSEQLVASLAAKKCFGETSLLAESPRSATIKALEETACVVLAKRSFDSVLKQVPEVALEVSRFLATRLHHQCQLTGFRYVSADELSYDPDIYGMFGEETLRRLKAIPLTLADGTLKVALTNPYKAGSIKELRAQVSGLSIEAVVCSREDYEAFVRRHRPRKESPTPILPEGNISAELCLPNGQALKPPLSNLIRAALNQKVEQVIVQGSHILTPRRGRLEDFRELSHEADEYKLKEQLQGAFFKTDSGAEIESTLLSFDPNMCQVQVSRVETTTGPRFCLNILESHTELPSLAEVVASPKVREKLLNSLMEAGKIVLLTGPPRSGKPHTAQIVLNALGQDKGSSHVMVLEEKPLTILRDIPQVKIGQDWAATLEAALLQNPTAISMHERTTKELPEVVRRLQGATSCLLCLRTDNPLTELSKLAHSKDLDESALEAITLLLQQRLLPRLCPHCKQRHTPSASVVKQLERFEVVFPTGKTYASEGCERCQGSGFLGRCTLVEALLVNPMIREMLSGGRAGSAIKKTAHNSGLLTSYAMSASALLKRGEVSTASLLKFFSGLV